MGPPLLSGGDIKRSPKRVPKVPLQWGRRFSAAETLVLDDKADAFNLLQWGRRFSAAETVGAVANIGAQDVASMGPPLLSGGDD